MATLFELKDEILKGKRITRKAWNIDKYQVLGFFTATPEDMFADDWEVEPLKKKYVRLYEIIYYDIKEKTFFKHSRLFREGESTQRQINPILYKIIKSTFITEVEVEE